MVFQPFKGARRSWFDASHPNHLSSRCLAIRHCPAGQTALRPPYTAMQDVQLPTYRFMLSREHNEQEQEARSKAWPRQAPDNLPFHQHRHRLKQYCILALNRRMPVLSHQQAAIHIPPHRYVCMGISVENNTLLCRACNKPTTDRARPRHSSNPSNRLSKDTHTQNHGRFC